MTTVEERLSRIEGGYEHLATKADVYQLENRMYQLEARMTRWLFGIVVSVGVLAVSMAGLFVQTLLN